MDLANPQSAILSAIIFNALIIVALIPLALKGVHYRPSGAAALLWRNLLIYELSLGGIIDQSGENGEQKIRTGGGSQFFDMTISSGEPRGRDGEIDQRDSDERYDIYPLAATGVAQEAFPD